MLTSTITDMIAAISSVVSGMKDSRYFLLGSFTDVSVFVVMLLVVFAGGRFGTSETTLLGCSYSKSPKVAFECSGKLTVHAVELIV